MKKIILMLLCAVLLLSGCSQQKAEPYYEETGEGIRIETQYKYYFTDDKSVSCVWTNETDKEVNFYGTFELHELGSDGTTWYKVGNDENADFSTIFSYAAEPNGECNAKYDITIYTNKLEDGKTYRISTYYFDEDGNNYQVYAEFTCDNELAEKEMLEISDGMMGGRYNTELLPGGDLTFLEEDPLEND